MSWPIKCKALLGTKEIQFTHSCEQLVQIVDFRLKVLSICQYGSCCKYFDVHLSSLIFNLF